MLKNTVLLKKRLLAAAHFVRECSVLADVGTDHAFLPIYCVENGKSVRAIAADINEMPLDRARFNINTHGLSDRIECKLTSGFIGLEGYGITDGAVCGMGGELIAMIINDSDFIKKDGFRLIIQPMTMLEVAREALSNAGFDVNAEITLFEEGKYYTVISADYTNNTSKSSKFELLFGDFSKKLFESEEVRTGYINHEINKYERVIKGKSSAGINAFEEKEIVSYLKERL